MAIGIFVGVVLMVVIVMGFAVFLNSEDNKGGVALVISIFCAIAFLLVPFSFHTVSTGEVAVVKHLGKITDVKEAGLHYSFWMTNKYVKYDTKVRTSEITTMAYSSDAQTMDIQMTVQYQIMNDKVIDIATQYGTLETLENRVHSIAIEKTKSVLSGYKAMDIIANRASISPAVEQAIMDAVGEEYYVNITTVVLTNIDFSDAFEIAVEEKMISEQTKLKADYDNQTKIAKAEAEAEAELRAATAKIDIAKAEAEALMIAAEAEAEANAIIDASLTEKILDKMATEAWNGELPVVVGNGEYILPADIIE